MKVNIFRSTQLTPCGNGVKGRTTGLFPRLAHWYEVTNSFLLSFYRVCETVNVVSFAPRPALRTMRQGQTLSLDENCGFGRIEIRRGNVWLTSSPADGDILLQAGYQCELTNNWPIVIEALEESDLTLFAKDDMGHQR